MAIGLQVERGIFEPFRWPRSGIAPNVISHRKVSHGGKRPGFRRRILFEMPIEPVQLNYRQIESRLGTKIDIDHLRFADGPMIPRPQYQSLLLTCVRIAGVTLHHHKVVDRFAREKVVVTDHMQCRKLQFR